MREPRPYSLVSLNKDNKDVIDYPQYYLHFKLEKGQSLIFVNTIPNMPGHCIVWKTTRDGEESHTQTYVGYHTNLFIELDEEDDRL